MPTARFVAAAALAAGVLSLAGAAFADQAPPKADAGEAPKAACISETSGFKMHGNTPGSLTLWQYAVTQKDAERMVGPRAKIGVLAASSLRVEPYKQSFKVLAHD